MMLRTVIILLSIACGALHAQSKVTPPTFWNRAFGDEGPATWIRLLNDDGKVTAEEAIEENYKLGSHDDGDRQLFTAFVLIELEDDPVSYLKAMMKEEKAERRAFAAIVTGLIGDKRLIVDLQRLTKDESPLDHWFWDTVADASGFALREHTSGGVTKELMLEGLSPPTWLKLPQQNPSDKSP